MSHPQSRRVLLLMIFVLAIGLAVSMFFYWRERTQDRYWFVQPQAPMSLSFPMAQSGHKLETTFWIVPGKFNSAVPLYGVIARFVFRGEPTTDELHLLEEVKPVFKIKVWHFKNDAWQKVPLYGSATNEKDALYSTGDLSGWGAEGGGLRYLDLPLLDFKYEPGQYYIRAELVKGDIRLMPIQSLLAIEHPQNRK
ncbi:hypothetical protein [Chromobacterium subtsugae]|uniref:hypothetical protein n=1 Tax=Chromobacterium subtsugae TaxID=251747 RepID=UPI000AE90D70|nr:hypothetical protein [Chromobacterium subtsugae]